MTIHAIIWDIGGVLERTEDPAPRENLAKRLGIETRDLAHLIFGHSDNFRVQRGEISLEDHWKNVGDYLGLSADKLPGVTEEFFAGDRLDLDLVEYIRELKHDHCTAVLSNYVSTLRYKITDVWRIDDAFHYLIISSEVGHMKPHPEIYSLALETLGYAPEETVFIDDFIENIEGAGEVGIRGILFQNPEQVKMELNNILNK
jgi:epoxide hydrolase-like predicted phosphatase